MVRLDCDCTYILYLFLHAYTNLTIIIQSQYIVHVDNAKLLLIMFVLIHLDYDFLRQ